MLIFCWIYFQKILKPEHSSSNSIFNKWDIKKNIYPWPESCDLYGWNPDPFDEISGPEFFSVVNDAVKPLAELAELAELDIVAAFESEAEVTTGYSYKLWKSTRNKIQKLLIRFSRIWLIFCEIFKLQISTGNI